MALTFNPSVEPYWNEYEINDFYVATCAVTATTSESDAYTKKAPKGLDGSKPFLVAFHCNTAPDNGTLPLYIWAGWDERFAITGDTTTVLPVVAGTGAKAKLLCADAKGALTASAVYAMYVDPNLAVADITALASIATGFRARCEPAPYYAFHIDGATLTAHTGQWVVMQKK